MLNSRPAQVTIFIVLVLALLGVGYWHIFLHGSHNHSDVASATSNTNDTQVDTQGSANVIVTYRADLSSSQAVFDIDITTDQDDLTKYNYKSNLVLTDSDINPLPYKEITEQSVSKGELKARLISNKFPGNHFHFDVRSVGGIDDRVLHFYHPI